MPMGTEEELVINAGKAFKAAKARAIAAGKEPSVSALRKAEKDAKDEEEKFERLYQSYSNHMTSKGQRPKSRSELLR